MDHANVRIVHFPFRDKKTAQAAAHLLSLHGGPLNYMLLIKVLYMSDREMLKRRGISITGDRLVSMKHGPVLSRVLNLINGGPGEWDSSWFHYISPPSNYEVQLIAEDPPTDQLSRFELRILDDAYRTYGKPYADRPFDLVNLLHKILPEWTDPGDSSFAIQPEAILRDASWPESEIQKARDAADESCFLDAVAAP